MFGKYGIESVFRIGPVRLETIPMNMGMPLVLELA
jgi:hypothetical protein